MLMGRPEVWEIENVGGFVKRSVQGDDAAAQG